MHETDVLVVGSGPGWSCGRARSGARGRRTRYSSVLAAGGNITVVGVEGFAWYRREETIDSEGIGVEFEERAKSMGATSPEAQSRVKRSTPTCSSTWRTCWCRNRGSAAAARGPIAPSSGRAHHGVITESKSGRGAILAHGSSTLPAMPTSPPNRARPFTRPPKK